MDKLIELLNEHEKIAPSRLQRKYYSESGHIMYIDEEGEDVDDYRTDYEIISKDYDFIKWLVDNDKIGDNKNSDRYTIMKLMRTEINEGTVFEGTERYEFVIMILSIQDKPIEFLISILK